ncbi:carbamoyl phosphate synthase small subunit, partial [Campylobacter coli]|nr:carbamoyl phosphate synthase small subunit [Campylobacter coli]
TRYLVKILRDRGNLRAVISTEISSKEELKAALEKSAKIDEINVVTEVSTKKSYAHKHGVGNNATQSYNKAKKNTKKVAVIDYG